MYARILRGASRYAARRSAFDFAHEHHWREPDAITAQLAAEFGPVFRRGDEVAPIRNERADLLDHAGAQSSVAGDEAHYDRFRIFAEQPEEPALETLLHARGLTVHRTAQASAGVNVAAHMMGAQRCASIMRPITGETTTCIAPYDATNAAMLNAACRRPKVSSGSEYTFTLIAETAKKLSEMAAAAQAGVCAAGIAAVTSESAAPAMHTRKPRPPAAPCHARSAAPKAIRR